MSEELEIEFKNLLTETEYLSLLHSLGAKQTDFFTQENYYFDTHTEALKNLNSGLRIRILPTTAELTLKTPFGLHLLETTDSLSLEEAYYHITHQTIKPDGAVGKKLSKIGVAVSDLYCFGSLKTVRFEKKILEGTIVLDKSSYVGKTDYELEYEAPDHESGIVFFNNFLNTHHLPRRIGKNKIARMKDALEK